MNGKIKSYFKDFCKNGHIIPALFFTAILFTAIIVNYEFSIFNRIIKHNDVFTFVIVAAAIMAACVLFYFGLCARKGKITLADVMGISIAVVGLIWLIYTLIIHDSMTTHRLILIIGAIVIGLSYTALRIFQYSREHSPAKIFNRTFKGYCVTVVEKFSFPALVVIAGVCTCVTYLIFNAKFLRSFISIKDVNLIAVGIILAIPVIVYAIKSVFDRKINTVDAILFSGIVPITVTLIQILVKYPSEKKLAVWMIAVGVYLVAMLIRFVRFDLTAKITSLKTCKNCSVINYFGKLFKTYDVALILAAGALIAGTALVVLKTQAFKTYFGIKNGAISIELKLIPITIITLTAVATLGLGALVSASSLKRKDVCIGDLLLSICFSFVIFGFITLVSHPSPNLLKILIVLTVYCISLFSVRIVNVNK